MDQIVGFDRRLRLEWLDATLAFYAENADARVVAEHLSKYLESQLAGEAQRKTITVLLRIWVNVPQADQYLRNEAVHLATGLSPEERLWLHWGLALTAYPFFRDIAATVGHLGRLQGIVSRSQVRQRIIESWGQRTTLEQATQRLLRTFVDWNVLHDTDTRGSYELTASRRTESGDLAMWLLGCALRAHRLEQISLGELGHLAYLFPFDLLPFLGELRRSERFRVTHQGLDLEMVGLSY